MNQKITRCPLKTVDRAQFRDMCARFAAAEIGDVAEEQQVRRRQGDDERRRAGALCA